MGLLFPEHKALILGESLDSFLTSTMSFVGLVVILLECVRYLLGIKREPSRRTLKLRKVKNVTGEFLASGLTSSNPFLREEGLRFHVLADKIDYSVMKLIQADVPILAAQEHQHAKFHHMACKNTDGTDFITLRWVAKVHDVLFLRTPKWMMAGFCFMFESMSTLAAYAFAVLPWNKSSLTNLQIFHWFEEVEHATVTCHYLRELCPFYVRFACMFLFGMLMEVALVIPLTMPLYAVYCNPKIVFKPRTYLIDLPLYYFQICLVEYVVLPWMMVHFMCAIPHYDFFTNFVYEFFENLCEERGFEFEILEEQTFVLDKSLHSEPPKHNKYLDPWFYVSMVQPHAKVAFRAVEKLIVDTTQALDISFQELFANLCNHKSFKGKKVL